MASPRKDQCDANGVKVICDAGHRLEGDNLIVETNANQVTRRVCRFCRSRGARAGGMAMKRERVLAGVTTTVRHTPKPLRYISGLTPVQLADCQALLDEAMHREHQARGAKGGRPRKFA